MSDPGEFRRRALESISAAVQGLPESPTVAYVWPTECCSIACAHCSCSSRPAASPQRRRVALSVDRLVQFVVSAGCRQLVVCGGGEPLDEPEFTERVMAAAPDAGIRLAVYTSGVSPLHPFAPTLIVRRWLAALDESRRREGEFHVRLSLDPFYEERLGLQPIIEWIAAIESLAQWWYVSLRGLQLDGFSGPARLAAELGGHYVELGVRSGVVVTGSGREIPVDLKGFVFDGRGSAELLAERGLALPAAQRLRFESLLETFGRGDGLGRPFSDRLTVTRQQVDLEIHADASVHILEAQPPDTVGSYFDSDWTTLRARYYADPLVHLIVAGGLPRVADVLIDLVGRGLAPRSTVPFSLDCLADSQTLDLATAWAILLLEDRFTYPDFVRAEARSILGEVGLSQ